MPELDFLRGIAVIMVVLGHGFYWTVTNQQIIHKFHGIGKLLILSTQGGWLGVQLFFVLSGFLITGILTSTKDRPDYYKRFYFRRALRILPAYLAILIILWIFGFIKWPFLLISIFFASNLSAIFGIALQYGPLWTLAVEEQFYLLWPQAVKRMSEKSLAILAGTIVILTPIIKWIAISLNPQQDLFYYTWFVADALALGALLSIFIKSKFATRKVITKISLALMVVAIIILIIGAPFGILYRSTPLGVVLQTFPFNILFAGIIGLTLIVGTSNFKKIVLLSWVRYFGKISYGLYLVHLLIFYWFDAIIIYFSSSLNITFHETISGLIIRFIFAGGISVLVASLSRKYFEEFFLKFKDYEFKKLNQNAKQ
jgi:peptidoglycan/LPS O-acetylase OafA/YrhL